MNYRARIAITMAVFCVSIFCCGLASAEEGQQCPQDPVDMFIGYGADILCAIDYPGTTDLFRFNGTAGERIEIETDGVDWPCIELIGVKSSCSYNHQNWLDTVLPTTQEYTIRISDVYNSTGSYSLFLERTTPPSPDARQEVYGQNLTDSFDLDGDLDEFFFVASADDLIDITALSSDRYPCFTLYAPDAKTSWDACSYNHSNDLRLQLTQAGTYTILLHDVYYVSGDYRVVLQCLTGTCHINTIPDLSGYLTLRGAPLTNQLVGLVTPGPGGQTTTTDQNGYFQFLHAPNGNFTEYAPISARDNDASAASVHSNPDR